MNRIGWRQLASGLLAATLSLGIAACDDDTSSGSGDMSGAGGDMSANVMPDMTMTGTPGTGQVVYADIVGTAYTAPTTANPTGLLPRTHVLLTLPSLPKVAPMSDPSSDLDLTMAKGCTINRYTTTNLPHGDGDAGLVTYTGWNMNTATLAFNAKNGTATMGQAMANDPITCTRLGPLMTYTCFFGNALNTDGGVGAMGSLVGDVAWPVVPHALVQNTPLRTVVSTAPDQWPPMYDTNSPGACVKRYVRYTSDPGGAACTDASFYSHPADPIGSGCQLAVEVCEQTPTAELGVASIVEATSGGADYGAAMKTIGNGGGTDGGAAQFPSPLYIVSVTSGANDITAFGPDLLTGGNSLSFADGKIAKDQPLTITFSCDPNNLTKGAGCTTATLAAMLLTTDTGTKTAPVGGLPTGVGECIAKPTTGQIAISAAQMAALTGGQTGGSIKVVLANAQLALPVSTKGHTLVFLGGLGSFGISNF